MKLGEDVPGRVASLYLVLVATVAALATAGLLLHGESLTRIAVVSVLLGPVVAAGMIGMVGKRGVHTAFAIGTVGVVLVGIVLSW